MWSVQSSIKRWLGVVATLTLAIGACRYSPTDSSSAGTESARTSKITGQVRLEGVGDAQHADYSGVRIELIGTNRFTISNRAGLWKFEDVPEGAYDVQISMDGFDTIYWEHVPVLAPAGNHVPGVALLRKRVEETVVITVGEASGGIFFPCSVMKSPAGCYGVLVASKTNPPGPNADEHDWSFFGQIAWGLSIPVADLKRPFNRAGDGFKSGDSIYFALFLNGSGYSDENKRYDSTMRGYYRFNLYNRSNVVGGIVP